MTLRLCLNHFNSVVNVKQSTQATQKKPDAVYECPNISIPAQHK